MKPSRIDQLMAGYADGDAISHEAALLRDIFRSWGFVSDIYAPLKHVSPTLKADVKPLETYRPEPQDLCFHHYGIASPAADLFASAPCRRILIYHNITPAHYFKGYDDAVMQSLEIARYRLMDIVKTCDAVWAVSRFNAEELKAVGAPKVEILPLPFAKAPLDLPPQPEILQQYRVRQTTVLCVGRIAPNKKVEDLIQAFAWYTKAINPYSRLLIVGSPRSAPRYFTYLKILVGDLDLPNVEFVGFASPAGLVAYYTVADLFVSTSEHEGYGLPLVEAMYRGVPVIARAIGGVPEATAGTGILYDGLSAAELAQLFHRVQSDDALRADVLESQRRRIEEVLSRNLDQEVRTLLAGFLE